MHTPNQRAMKTSVLIRRFLPYFQKYLPILVFDLLCAALTTVCDLVLPLIVRSITSLAANDLAALTVSYVLRLGGVYVLLRVIDAAANFYMSSRGHIMGTYIERDMRNDLFAHLQELGFAYYSNAKVGQIMARITSDLFDVTEFAHHCPEEFFIAGIKIVVPFVILMGTSPALTLIIFAMVPLMLVCIRFFNKRMRDVFKESRHQVGEINAQVEDSLLGIRVVKSFANEPMELEKFHQGNDEFVRINTRKYLYMGGFNTSTRVFDGLMYIVVVVAGALFIIQGSITPADYMAYLLYVSTLLTSIRRIVEFMEQFQRGMTGIERFCEIMDEKPDIQDAPGAKELSNVRGDVTFDHVSFHYNDNDKNVLADINFHVKAGERVALVGPSGGGKTTLCNLIPRFYNVSGGRILIDGQDITMLTQRSLRENIGMVQQDVYMFSGTIYDNIAYGMPSATPEKVTEAARLAGAHEFIQELPEGYQTFVGERGVKLSGGQKQRISIARVFLKNPPILILDEATSALDNESERLVQKSLEKLSEGRTTFTIAHRLTTIRNASTIWVLTENGIEEQGTHQQLMQKGGLYARLYQMYTEDGQ
ncbi:MAG: ABC transporter ATP-binding protein/permease [Clostridiales bacterium]|nr:ABC transporter ATP-binding protein/permease [Clostridiales bacterium]MDY4008450.1 ABC transporter ATP-binding protein [Candidatus Limiplasma sp.]